LLKATEEEKQKVRDAFTKKREKLAEDESEFNKNLDKEELDAQLSNASVAFGAIAGAVGEQSALGKTAAAAQSAINTYRQLLKL